MRPRLAAVDRPAVGAPLAHPPAVAEAGALDDQGDDLLFGGDLSGGRRAGTTITNDAAANSPARIRRRIGRAYEVDCLVVGGRPMRPTHDPTEDSTPTTIAPATSIPVVQMASPYTSVCSSPGKSATVLPTPRPYDVVKPADVTDQPVNRNSSTEGPPKYTTPRLSQISPRMTGAGMSVRS